MAFSVKDAIRKLNGHPSPDALEVDVEWNAGSKEFKDKRTRLY